jgi:hypothetical protein
VDVAERLRTFLDRYPDGSLQPADPAHPVELLRIGEDVWLVFTAAAYRTPDDPRPGMGTAWEAYPGRTPYTRGSELQNAETSAWGRAIASLGVATRRGIATAQDVDAARRNRGEDTGPGDELVARIGAGMRACGMDAAGAAAFITDQLGTAVPTRAMTRAQAEQVAAALDQLQPPDPWATPDQPAPAQAGTAEHARGDSSDTAPPPEGDGSPPTGQAAGGPENPAQATAAQLRMLAVLCDQAGLTDRADALDLIASLIGRPVESRRDLTRAEASRVIEHMAAVVGPLPPDPDNDAGDVPPPDDTPGAAS